MKHNCELVQDLLPLYHDDVCSTESRRVVDEHLEECERCKAMLNDLDMELLPEAEEVKPLVSIQVSWNNEKRKVFLKGLMIALSLFLVLVVGDYALTDWNCVPMGKDDLVVTDVFQTSDGVIHVFYNDLYDMNYYSSGIELGEDGYGYIKCFRPILARKENTYPRTWSAGTGFTPNYLNCLDKNGNMVSVDRIYLGISGDPENSILVWETGMEVRQATEVEEEHYCSHDIQGGKG